MKKILPYCIIAVIGIIFITSCKQKQQQKNMRVISDNTVLLETNAEKIILHHVMLIGIYTAIDIPCEDFEEIFSDIIKKDTITNSDEIYLLKTYINNLSPIDNSLSIDTRAKLYFVSPIDTIMFCLDSGIVYSNGNYYEISDVLFDYIENFEE